MKKCVAAVLTMTCGVLCGAAPVLADQGAYPAAPPQEPSFAAPSGEASSPAEPKGDLDPRWVGAMSAVIPCTGQWYNGELLTWKTAAMAVLEGGSIFVLVYFLVEGPRPVAFAGGGGMLIAHTWSAWDAWNVAKKNQGLALNMDQERQRVMVSYNVPF
ncbi:MAG: hypothetical protein IT574_00235 [Candidatus Aureabacteria bacterium]|nr:hypothetical protein [Candidatus Auribacterota bacterium]HOE27120.1 hypothetical protein [bacterium]HQM52353.1 hypothetical protein [bacterium]